MWVQIIQLRHFAVGSPTPIAVPSLEQVRVGELVETTRCVESRGELVRDRFVVGETIAVGRTDGLFVQLLGIEHAPFNPSNLRIYQCRAVFKVLRAMPCPNRLLLLVSSQSFEMGISRFL